MIKPCKKKCRYTPVIIYEHLKQTNNYIFHETAAYYMKFLLSAVKKLKEQYPTLELHYDPGINPEYKHESPHIKKHSKDTRNKGIFANEITPQSLFK